MFQPFRLLPSWAHVYGALGLVLLAPLIAGSAETTVTLKNGDRLSGTNLVETTEAVSLETPLGKIRIPRGLIEMTVTKTNSVPPVPVVAPEPSPPKPSAEELARQYQELLAKYESGQLPASEYHAQRAALMEQIRTAGYDVDQLKKPPPPSVAAGASGSPKSSASAKPTEGGAKPKIKSQFTGEARLGTDLLFGTKEQQIYTAKLKGVHTWGRLKNSADYMFTYGHADGDLSANRMDGSLKSDWQLDDRVYTYNLGGAGYDEIRKVELRYEMGPGMGYHFIKAKGFVLSGETGLHYQTEIRRASDDKEQFYYRFADIATWSINPKLSVDQKFEWLPQVEDIYMYQLRLEANLRYKLAENLALVMTVVDRYQTDPAPNVANNDLQVRSSIGVSF